MERRPREDRRRRVRREDTAATATKTTRARSSGTRSQSYEGGAVTTAQPRITDLIPRRKLWVFCLFLAMFIPVAAVEALYVLRITRLDDYYQYTGALHLFGSGTIANWASSMLLALAGLTAVVIYGVRRLKVDDYRGRYRMWLWAAAFCGLVSLDTSTGLHRLFQATMVRLTDTKLWGDGAAWWLLTGGIIGGVLLVRITCDAWRSRGTTLSLLLMLACYTAATLFYLRVWAIGPVQVDIMVWSGCLMTGHALLLFSFLLYARYVCRSAAGEIKASRHRPAKTKSESASETKSNSGGWSWWRGSKSKSAAKTTIKKTKRKPTPQVPDHADHEEDYDLEELERLTNPQLDKSQQRRLRKKNRREQRRAA